ncbi:hypothetical protein EJB05_31387, partial [Eragrostis curvula]
VGFLPLLLPEASAAFALTADAAPTSSRRSPEASSGGAIVYLLAARLLFLSAHFAVPAGGWRWNKTSKFPAFPFVHSLAKANCPLIIVVATPLIAGLAVAAAALAGRYSIQAWNAYKARPVVPRMRKFYEGGFQPTMNRREAALILGVRESANAEKVKEAHKKVMVANHPDAGGSHYLASKINEAKDVMLGKTKGSGSAF